MTEVQPGAAPRRPLAVRASDRVPGWTLAVASMVIWATGSALSISLFAAIGVAGTAWLRLTLAGLILLVLNRPRVRGRGRRTLASAIAFGVAIGGMALTFLAAIERIPLGTAITLGFLGPMGLAVLGTRRARDLAWPVLAIFGVLALTEPWVGSVDPLGIAFGLTNAVCWALYMVLSARVGGVFGGLDGLSITVPIAALVTAGVGVPQALGHVTPGVVALAAWTALLVAVIPYSLDMLALRRISTPTFGTLSALQPAIAAAIGLVVLGQVPASTGLAGTLLVVIAGVGAMRAEASRFEGAMRRGGAAQPPGSRP